MGTIYLFHPEDYWHFMSAISVVYTRTTSASKGCPFAENLLIYFVSSMTWLDKSRCTVNCSEWLLVDQLPYSASGAASGHDMLPSAAVLRFKSRYHEPPYMSELVPFIHYWMDVQNWSLEALTAIHPPLLFIDNVARTKETLFIIHYKTHSTGSTRRMYLYWQAGLKRIKTHGNIFAACDKVKCFTVWK